MLLQEMMDGKPTRRAVMQKLRKKFDLGSEVSYSEEQKSKKQRMVKLYNIKSDNVDKLVDDINKFIKDEEIPGVTARKMTTSRKGAYRRGVKSVAFQFDQSVYGR